MEDVYYIAAIVAFALAACSLVACVAIFFRAHVLDAVRFLRHKPVSAGKRGAVSIPKAAPKRKPAAKGPGSAGRGAPPVLRRDGSESETDALCSEGSERGTDVLEGEASERPTGVLAAEASESPTGVLAADDSERPTGLLDEDDSERPTGVLMTESSENPTGVLGDEASERPTGLLYGEPAKVACDENRVVQSRGDVAQHEETMFRFMLKHHEIVVHTRETIA